uniref:Uncharacterized protein n=1 Tax=Timema cristinae TaxID=61476 RepID=A0A7R9D6N4_TIMCR|nr:unnamed protein product [Timema cristinae]
MVTDLEEAVGGKCTTKDSCLSGRNAGTYTSLQIQMIGRFKRPAPLAFFFPRPLPTSFPQELHLFHPEQDSLAVAPGPSQISSESLPLAGVAGHPGYFWRLLEDMLCSGGGLQYMETCFQDIVEFVESRMVCSDQRDD